ncbi:phage head morphogenesis protein [Nocardia sp. NPDC052566]|uniref:phage head morphogenesis protein n=1 Tax=Nocardia sp. NPDC052566 TaxID=3364330 RepID=UPI0037C708D6
MIDIDDIDRWNVADIEKVFQVCSSHAEHCDDRSTNLGSLQAFESWDGEASAAAKRSIGKTRVDFDSHGTHVAAIAKAAKTAADEVSTIKSKLTGLRGEASKDGFRINGDGTVVRTIQGPYTSEQLAVFEGKRKALQLDVNQLLINAQMVDTDLAAAIKGADGETSPEELAKQNHDPTYAAVYGLKSLGLPEYPEFSLSDVEARNWDALGKLKIDELNKQLERAGVPLEERSKIAQQLRNEVRARARDLMSNRPGAQYLAENEKNYGSFEEAVRDKMTRKGLTREQALQDIIDTSTKGRASVNEALGVDSKNPQLPDPKEVRARMGGVEPAAVAEGAGSKALRIAGKAAIPLAAAYEVYDGYNQVKAGNETVPEAVGKGVGAVGGMVAGAEVGATIGAFGGPIGAGVGGVVGGVVGGIAGSSVGKTIGGWFS